MSEEQRDQLITELTEEVKLLRWLVSVLCAFAVPRHIMDILMETLDVPLDDLPPATLQAIDKALSAFASDLANQRAIMVKNKWNVRESWNV